MNHLDLPLEVERCGRFNMTKLHYPKRDRLHVITLLPGNFSTFPCLGQPINTNTALLTGNPSAHHAHNHIFWYLTGLLAS